MNAEKNMTRREALKKMGAVAAGIGLGIVAFMPPRYWDCPIKKKSAEK